MSNYDKLLREKEQQATLESGQKEMNWKAMEKLLITNEPADSDSQKKPGHGKRISKITIVITVVVVFIYWGYKQFSKNKPLAHMSNYSGSAIKPPLQGVDIPYELFEVNANEGDTIFTKNGSVIVFPRNSVMTANGTIVTGTIDIKCREFNDVLDYSFAGIPMTYDSAGVKYTFISSGMIDIGAFQNGNKLFVNPTAKPVIHLRSTNPEPTTNLYQLDTVTGKWNNKGKDEVNVVDVTQKNENSGTPTPFNRKTYPAALMIQRDSAIASEAIFQKPAPPHKASGQRPVIEIDIDPMSFEELMVYDNLKFEVIGGDPWNAGDSNVIWQHVKLETLKESEVYRVTFTKAEKKVSYLVNPALEEEDYEQAKEVYAQKMKEYEQVKSKRKEQMRQDQQELKKEGDVLKQIREKTNDSIAAQNKKVAELNQLIVQRNMEIERANVRIRAQIEKNKRHVDSLIQANDSIRKLNLADISRARKRQDSLSKVFDLRWAAEVLNNNIIRSFQIDGFGYWNCDQPTLPGGIMFAAAFKDESGNPLRFGYLNVASYGIKRLLVYYDNNITVLPNTNHVMWGFIEGNLYYMGYTDYKALSISRQSRNVEIRLHKYKGEAQSVEQLKEVFFR